MGRPRKSAPKTHLSHEHLARMLQLDAENQLVRAQLEQAHLRAEVVRLRHELEAKQLVDRAQRDEALQVASVKAAADKAAATLEQNRQHARDVGELYGVDLTVACFDPLTGEIKQAEPQIVSPAPLPPATLA